MGECCRDGGPSGRVSHLHRGTLELCQSDHRVFGHLPDQSPSTPERRAASSRKTLGGSKHIPFKNGGGSQAVSQPALTGRPMSQCTIGPVSSGLGEGLAGRDFLVPSCSSDSLWQVGRLQADFVRQLDSFSCKILVWLASGLSEQCVKKQCGLAGSRFGGRMALDHRLS